MAALSNPALLNASSKKLISALRHVCGNENGSALDCGRSCNVGKFVEKINREASVCVVHFYYTYDCSGVSMRLCILLIVC